jgi:hypothetical protein
MRRILFDGAQIEIGLLPLEAIVIGNVLWIKVSGVWKSAILWLNVGGTWKQSTPRVKVAGVWR